MRRPIAARNSVWAQHIAQSLAQRGIRPNAVSAGSVVCAALALLCLLGAAQTTLPAQAVALYLLAAGFVQLRLLCNLFDGMIAVEFGRASVLGPIFNDLPDRPADLLILVGCGYAAPSVWLPLAGWLAGSLALITAYTRVLGVAVGAQEHFGGPMAKQHRMAAVTVACLLSACEAGFHLPHRIMALTLPIIAVGCLVTVVRRVGRIAGDLQSKPKTDGSA